MVDVYFYSLLFLLFFWTPNDFQHPIYPTKYKRCRISFHFVCLFAVFNNLWQSRCVWVLPHFVASLKFSECLVSQLSVPQLSVQPLPTAIRCKRSTYTYALYSIWVALVQHNCVNYRMGHAKTTKEWLSRLWASCQQACLSVCLSVSLSACRSALWL